MLWASPLGVQTLGQPVGTEAETPSPTEQACLTLKPVALLHDPCPVGWSDPRCQAEPRIQPGRAAVLCKPQEAAQGQVRE